MTESITIEGYFNATFPFEKNKGKIIPQIVRKYYLAIAEKTTSEVFFEYDEIAAKLWQNPLKAIRTMIQLPERRWCYRQL